MPKGMFFWIVWLLCVLFGVWCWWPTTGVWYPLGGLLVVFVLIGVLGWAVFGPPIQ